MNRQEQIEYCDNCIHTGYHPDKGVICGLHEQVPILKNVCPDFTRDPSQERYQNWKEEEEEKKRIFNRTGLWTKDEDGNIYKINKLLLISGLILFFSGVGLIIYARLNEHPSGTYTTYGIIMLIGMRLAAKSLIPVK